MRQGSRICGGVVIWDIFKHKDKERPVLADDDWIPKCMWYCVHLCIHGGVHLYNIDQFGKEVHALSSVSWILLYCLGGGDRLKLEERGVRYVRHL